MRLSIFFLILIWPEWVYAQKMHVTFDPLKCITCSSGLYALSLEKNINSIDVVLLSRYAEDSLELHEKFDFKKHPKIILHYSDSLYNALSRSATDAELIIFDSKNKELYRSALKQINLTEIMTFYSSKGKAMNDTLCFSAINKNLNTFIVQGGLVISQSVFDKWTVINAETGKEYAVKINDTLKRTLYKSYYKDSFKIKYPVINSIIGETPTFKPSVNNVQYYKGSIIAIFFQIKDYNINGDDTAIFGSGVIGLYDIDKNQTLGYYTFDKSLKDILIWNLYLENGEYMAQGIYKEDTRFCFMSLKVDEKKKVVALKKVLDINKPAVYKTQNVPSLVEFNVTANKNVLSFDFDDKIVLLDDGKSVQIPFSEFRSGKYDEYQIRDVYQDQNSYFVLYLQADSIYSLRFSKIGNVKATVKIGSTTTIDKYGIKFYRNGNEVIYKPLKSNCLIVSKIAY